MSVSKSLIFNYLPVKKLTDPWEIRLGNKTEFILLSTMSHMLESYYIKFISTFLVYSLKAYVTAFIRLDGIQIK